MKKVKLFFQIFLKSLIPQYSYYHKIPKISFWFSLRYLIFFIITFNLLFFLILFTKITPQVILPLKKDLVSSVKNFPDDLIINIHNGQISTNYNHPYFLWFDYQNKKILLAVVDESATPDKINQYRSLVLITKKEFVTRNFTNAKAYRTYSLNRLFFTIDKKLFSEIEKRINKSYGKMVFFSLLFSLFTFPFITLVLVIIFFLIVSLISFFVYRFTPKKISFKKIFQISFHSSTLPLLYDSIYDNGRLLFGGEVYNKWHCLSFFILVLIFLLCGIYEAYYDLPQNC